MPTFCTSRSWLSGQLPARPRPRASRLDGGSGQGAGGCAGRGGAGRPQLTAHPAELLCPVSGIWEGARGTRPPTACSAEGAGAPRPGRGSLTPLLPAARVLGRPRPFSPCWAFPEQLEGPVPGSMGTEGRGRLLLRLGVLGAPGAPSSPCLLPRPLAAHEQAVGSWPYSAGRPGGRGDPGDRQTALGGRGPGVLAAGPTLCHGSSEAGASRKVSPTNRTGGGQGGSLSGYPGGPGRKDTHTVSFPPFPPR